MCTWTDIGGSVSKLIEALGTADLPPNFWPVDNGGYGPGAYHLIDWATLISRASKVPYQHFDIVNCPTPNMVPSPGGDIYTSMPPAEPPTGPAYIWIFWDTVPFPPKGALPPIVGQAYDEVGLPPVGINTSPNTVAGIAHASIINFPTWFWVNGSSWHTVVATASGGGYVATVWATPISVTWRASWDLNSASDNPEGGVDLAPTDLNLVCKGPGTPYSTADNPSSASPDCGTTFTQSTFGTATPLTATVEWDVTWALSSTGGVVGGEGTFPAIEQTASEPLRVLQIESVVSRTG